MRTREVPQKKDLANFPIEGKHGCKIKSDEKSFYAFSRKVKGQN
jgi:hypothetical protein